VALLLLGGRQTAVLGRREVCMCCRQKGAFQEPPCIKHLHVCSAWVCALFVVGVLVSGCWLDGCLAWWNEGHTTCGAPVACIGMCECVQE
jgi:hypothetical protein